MEKKSTKADVRQALKDYLLRVLNGELSEHSPIAVKQVETLPALVEALEKLKPDAFDDY